MAGTIFQKVFFCIRHMDTGFLLCEPHITIGNKKLDEEDVVRVQQIRLLCYTILSEEISRVPC